MSGCNSGRSYQKVLGSAISKRGGCGCNEDPCKDTYQGPNLPCTGIETYTSMEVVIQMIDQKICELTELLNTITTTSTTTTLPL